MEQAQDNLLGLTWAGIAVMVLAQAGAKLLLRLYARRVLAAMNTATPPERGQSGWTPERIRDAMEAARRRALGVLIGVVAVYSLAAAVIYAQVGSSGAEGRFVTFAVALLLFASYCGPVVLLGLSAGRFAQHYWNWFAPAVFASVAIQIVVVRAPADARNWIGAAVAAVLAVTAGLVTLRLFAGDTRMARWGGTLYRWRLAIAAALLLLVGVLGQQVHEAAQPPFAITIAFGCAVAAAAIMLCYLTMTDRMQRIFVPLLAMGFLATAMVGLVVGFLVAEGLQSWGGTGAAVATVAGLGAGLWTARQVLGWVAIAYESKVFSESQFQVYAWMCAVACVVVATEVLINSDSRAHPARYGWLAAATVLALLLYSLLVRWFVNPLPVHRRLLVLRVFAHDEQRQETVLEDLEYRWRFIGPIVLIGGTDYAQHTMSPADAAHFLRRGGRVDDLFINDDRELDRRLLAIDEAPDPDGRYRVNELFCDDTTWKPAVRKLLDSSEAVLVDLREYGAERRGTTWELELLRERDALGRTVVLIGDDTRLADVMAALHVADEAALRATVGIVDMRTPERDQLVERLLQRLPGKPLPALTLQVAAG